MASRTARTVVVVEDRAHWSRGHYPLAAVDLARGLAAADCQVELLTVDGWAFAESAGPQPFTVTRVPRLVRSLFDLARRLEVRGYGRGMPRSRRRRAIRDLHAATRGLAVALSVRTAERRHRGAAEVISFCYSVSPPWVAALAGPGRVLVHATDLPATVGPFDVRVERWLRAAARRAEARRRANGGRMRIVAGSPVLLEEWARCAPYLEPVAGRHAATRTEHPDPDARSGLGIAPDAKVALVFGAPHSKKDLDVVWRAFTELPDWTLLVVGKVEEAHRAWVATHGGPAAVTHGGFVAEPTRVAAYSAADLVVLSFVADHIGESMVLQEAVAFGVPVVCSEGSTPAEDVARFGLGTCFAPGDAAALVEAVRRAPATLDPAALAAAREAASSLSVAQSHLAALDHR